MPRAFIRRCMTAALAVVAALTLWLAPHVVAAARASAASVAPAQSEVRFEFGAAFYRVSEGDGVATVTVVRTGDVAREAAVEYLADSGYLLAKGCGYLTWVGTATPGVDYARASGTLRFAAGETSKTFQVTIHEDAQVESRHPETVFLSLDFSHLAPPNGSGCYGSTGIIYIHDNDPAPTPTPTPAPTDKRKIAFGSNRDGNHEIYVMDEDGAGLRRLTNTLATEGHPAWSPDGSRLAFVSDREGRNAVYVMNADGTNVTRLAAVAGEASEPAWSPDGTRLAYVAQGEQIGANIYVVNVDGTGRRLLSGDRAFVHDLSPAWSSDGARIAFVSNRDGSAANYEVYVMNADGTGQTRLTDNPAHESLPAWKPQARPPAPSAPVLLTEPNTTWAVALDSVTQVADPFPVASSSNFSADGRTRVSLFAAGLTSASAADITAEAEDSTGRRYPLPVEHAAPVPRLDSVTQVIVRLPDELDGLGHVWVSLNVRGTLTNRAVITIRNRQ